MPITYRLASVEDRDVIMEFLLHYFRVQEPITHSLGATVEDIKEFYSDLRDNGLKGPYSTLAFQGQKLVGICLNAIQEISTNRSKPKKETRLEDDYAEAIATGPYETPNANRLAVFIDVVEEGLCEELALYEELATSVRVFKIDVLGVHPEYVGRKIEK
uniref:N-acetyltransferase domain-containing protein n=1 Tax=Acrobeloides nanus TaxID=290746 RepID=A0A914BYI8_9BILA